MKASKSAIAKQLFDLAQNAQRHGWSAEELLVGEARKRERGWRKLERKRTTA